MPRILCYIIRSAEDNDGRMLRYIMHEETASPKFQSARHLSGTLYILCYDYENSDGDYHWFIQNYLDLFLEKWSRDFLEIIL
jgi:hypothetical protein